MDRLEALRVWMWVVSFNADLRVFQVLHPISHKGDLETVISRNTLSSNLNHHCQLVALFYPLFYGAGKLPLFKKFKSSFRNREAHFTKRNSGWNSNVRDSKLWGAAVHARSFSVLPLPLRFINRRTVVYNQDLQPTTLKTSPPGFYGNLCQPLSWSVSSLAFTINLPNYSHDWIIW